jgi:histidine ammonia-lyase
VTPVPGAALARLVRDAGWDAVLPRCDEAQLALMAESRATVTAALARGGEVYGLTRGFGPLVTFAAGEDGEQGAALIAHLGTGQGRPLDPDACRLIGWLRLTGMRKGFSAVSADFWHALADLWNRGFTPAIPRDGTVSASGDLQPLAHAALAHTGHGEAWVRDADGRWCVEPAGKALATLGAEPIEWPAREALAFVNGTGAGLAVTILNHQSVLRLTRAVAAITGRLTTLLRANPEHFHPGIGLARGQAGQLTATRWVRAELPPELTRDPARPLQEPYSLRCAPQVLGAVLDQLDAAEVVLLAEAGGCTDNPITHRGEILHGGNFHAMPVALCSDQIGLAAHQVAYLAERQLALLCSPGTNGGLPPMLTPRPGRGSGLAGVQISATSFVSRIRQLAYPASLTTLPTNGWNQDHVPMALNGANSVTEAMELAWLTVGSLALGVAQLTALVDEAPAGGGVWAELAEISPPLAQDRPLAEEVRAAGELFSAAAAALLAGEEHRENGDMPW